MTKVTFTRGKVDGIDVSELKAHYPGDRFPTRKNVWGSDQEFERIFTMLSMSGEYHSRTQCEEQAYEILNNPHIYPEYF